MFLILVGVKNSDTIDFLEIAYLTAMLDRDILFLNRPLDAYISLGKVVLRMRGKISIARSETTGKRAGSRH